MLSGPSFAKEMAPRMPTVVTIAAHWEKVAQRMPEASLQTETFRTYTTIDVIGVQIGGALKNVIAIAAGISDGLGFGHNARSAASSPAASRRSPASRCAWARIR